MKKNLITKLLEGAKVELPYYDEDDFPTPVTNPFGVEVNLKHALGVVDSYTPKPCTLQDYENCLNYKGDKKIPICAACPYRGNVGRGLRR